MNSAPARQTRVDASSIAPLLWISLFRTALMARASGSKSSARETPDVAFDFEAAMTELEGVVANLEQGDLPLEEAMRAFERGIALTRACQEALKSAEQKVEMLSKGADPHDEPVPFDADDEAP
jgi:exodeoxyribonuclease VII small subunit